MYATQTKRYLIMNPLKIRLFKNNYKEQGDKKPAFQNSSISYPDDVFQEDYVFKKGSKHQIGLWKNEDGSLSIQISEKTDVSVAQPQATQQSSQSFTPRDPAEIMGTPEYQKAQMEKSQSQTDEEDIPF